MKKNFVEVEKFVSAKKARVIMFALTIALFVLGAGAPMAGIGIGK